MYKSRKNMINPQVYVITKKQKTFYLESGNMSKTPEFANIQQNPTYMTFAKRQKNKKTVL